ncbi:TetR/AcrR family transcriptional regulator [Bacillus aerolatus]|nr:TetR/AcrR family transcriptional regulator [Bacillus aerolatus]
MNRKQIQVNRMYQYFVDAAVQIIEEEGIKNVTARKVAERAGYTTSTIYNYFKDLSHLLFFASMNLVKDYVQEVNLYMSKEENYLDKYILSWECFCKHSFSKPEIYYALFIEDLGEKPDELLKHYYSIYPSDLIGVPDEIKPTLFEPNLGKRNKMFLEIEKKHNIRSEHIDDVNNMIILLWKGMMSTLLNNRGSYKKEEATEITVRYIKELAQKLSKD